MKSWPAGRGLVGVAEALVKVGLAVAVEVVQPGDLVAAEHVDLPSATTRPEGLVQARRRTAASGPVRASASSPSTRQTSPWIVQSIAVPSGKKSWSPKKSRAFHGLSNGGSIVSTT